MDGCARIGLGSLERHVAHGRYTTRIERWRAGTDRLRGRLRDDREEKISVSALESYYMRHTTGVVPFLV